MCFENVLFKKGTLIEWAGVRTPWTPPGSALQHVTSLSAKCFFQLRQLRRIRRSVDDDSVATLVHAFVVNRVDYCVGLLAKLQRVLNAAA